MIDLRFEPSRALRNGHLQTLWSSFGRRYRRLPSEVHTVAVDSLTRVRVRVNEVHDSRAPAIVLVHGMASQSDAPYLRALADKANRAGMHAYRVDLRGCGQTESWSPLAYQAGLTSDLRAVLETVRRRQPQARVTLAAWSLGGNMALKLVGELGHAARRYVDQVVAVCPPIDLDACATRTDGRGMARVYRAFLLRSLRAQVRQRARLGQERFEVGAQLARAKTLRTFDELVTARVWHYSDANEYYRHASAVPWIARIRVPTWIFATRDDPLVPFEIFEALRVDHDVVRLQRFDHGGHCSFYARDRGRDPDRWWIENRLIDLAAVDASLTP